MIGGLPRQTAEAIGLMVLHTVLAGLAFSVVAAVAGVVCLVIGLRAGCRRPMLFRWVGAVLLVLACVPPVFLLSVT